MATERLYGRRVAFLATDGVEQDELGKPWDAVKAEGGTPELISVKEGDISSETQGKPGRSFHVDHLVTDVSARDYDALVLPGGVKNPDTLRMNSDAVRFVQTFLEQDKPVAAICHGPWLLVEADAVRGRTLTSWPSLRTDVKNAGGQWVDKEVAVDQKLVTSRKPADLPAFCEAMVSTMADAIEERSMDEVSEASFPASDPPPGPAVI
jgi:protease I